MSEEDRGARRLALFFFLQTSIAVVSLALLMPLLGNPDEANHLRRVDQIAHGGLIGHRKVGDRFWSGGTIASGIGALNDVFRLTQPSPRLRVTAGALSAMDRIGWGDRIAESFPNTSIYPPTLYLPAVMGEWLGRSMHLRIARTAIIARLGDGIVDTTVIALAIAAAGGAAAWLMVIASLPMSLSLLSSIGQDGGMLACAAVATALAGRIGAGADAQRDRKRLLLLSVSIALLASARPVYVPVSIVVLLITGLSMRNRILAFLAINLAVAAWSLVDATWVMTNWPALFKADPARQIDGLIAHPLRLWSVAHATLVGGQGAYGQSYWEEAVGVLGPLDVILPGWFYVLTAPMLGGVGVLLLWRRRPVLAGPGSLVMLAALVAATGLILLIQYVVVNAVGAPTVGAVQGRYFLPIGLMVPLALPTVGRWLPWTAAWRTGWKARLAGDGVVAAFTTLSCLVTVISILRRYWL